MYQCLFFSLGTYLYILRILEVNGRTDVRVTTEPSSIFTRTRSDKKLIMAAISGMQGAQSIICNFDRVKKDKSNEEIKKIVKLERPYPHKNGLSKGRLSLHTIVILCYFPSVEDVHFLCLET